MAVLAVDQGTSATKAVVVCPDRGVLAEVDVAVGGETRRGERVEQDPEAVWTSVLDAGRAALAQAGEPVDAVGVANQGETVLAWDTATGRPVTPALSWQDRSAAAATRALAASPAGTWLPELTGLPVDPYFAAPKMALLAGTLPAATPRSVRVTTLDAFLLARLTGQYVTDVATASRTGLLDLDARAWSARAGDAYGLDVADQPTVVATDETVGYTDAFGPRLAVAGVVVDQQAALFAQGCTQAGQAKCTYGTGGFLLATLGPVAVRSRAGLATSVAWAQRDGAAAYCADGQVYSVGAALSWLVSVGLLDGPGDLDARGLGVPDADGVLFVPALSGVGAPTWAPGARASLTGLGLGTTRAHVARAAAEGIAAQVALLVRAVGTDLGAPLRTLRVDGGLTRSRLLLQAQADLAGVVVEVYPHACATALGVAALALRARGGPGAEEAVTRGWSPAAVVEPSGEVDAAAELLARYEAALADAVARA